MSMDGVGTMKACTSVVVLNSRIRISSVHSWTKFLTFSAYRFMGTLLDRIAVDEHETSAPTRLGEHMLRQIDNVVQADRGGIELIRGSVKGPVNDERLANNVLARDESPVAAVERVITVVAHRKVQAGGDHHVSVHHMVQKHVRGSPVDGNIRLAREIVAVRIDVIRLMIRVRLIQTNAVQVHLLVDQADAVAGHSDAALDEGLTDIDGIAEHDDIAALHVGVRQEIFAHRAVGGEGQLIHQQMVADEECVFHGTRRNYIRLY